jgi:hypothetical protein
MRLILIAACTLAAALAASPARADGFITPYVGFNFGGDSANCVSFTNCEEKRTNWGVTLGSTHGIFGFAEDIGYAPQFFGKTPEGTNGVLHFMSDFMVIVPAGPVQPYAFVGIGLIRPHAKLDASALSLTQNALGHDVGGGINLFFARGVGVRGELRHLRTFDDVNLGIFSSESKLDFWRASAGLTLRF